MVRVLEEERPRAEVARRPRLLLAVPAAALCAGALAACDPCAGVVGCRVSPRAGLGGQIVERHPAPVAPGQEFVGAGATPVAGVRVQVIRVGGTTAADTVATVTDGAGWWHVDLDADTSGPLAADVVVTPGNGIPPYRVTGVALRASTRRGDGTVVGRWTRRGYISAIGEVFDAATGERVGGARVTAVRSGGATLAATPATRAPMVSEPGTGRFLYDAEFTSEGATIVDFTVERDGYQPAVRRGVLIRPQYEWVPPNVNGDMILHVPFVPR